MDARRTESTCVTPTCVAPRHVDAPRDFIFYFFSFSERAARGGGGRGGRCQTFFFSCSADHERDWPSCKVVFFRAGNQCAECEKQQQQFLKGRVRGNDGRRGEGPARWLQPSLAACL